MPDDIVTLQPVFGLANEVETTYRLDFTGVNGGSLPPGWRCVQDGGTVHEYPETYGQGARTFAGFGGYQGKALYWRNDCAEYGRQAAWPLTLAEGNYILSFATAAWKGTPQYKAKIVGPDEVVIAETDVLTATPNADGNSSADLTAAQTTELPFTISEAGNYIIRFEDASTYGGLHEFLLAHCDVILTSTPDAIRIVNADGSESAIIYGIRGERRERPRQGLNIIRTADGKTRKVLVK